MTNRIKGEVEIKLNGASYIIRPSFNALVSIESALNKSILQLLSEFHINGLKIKDQAIIIKHGIKAYNNKELSEDQILIGLKNSNLLEITLKLFEFLKNGVAL